MPASFANTSTSSMTMLTKSVAVAIGLKKYVSMPLMLISQMLVLFEVTSTSLITTSIKSIATMIELRGCTNKSSA